jgi:Spy/CpxP family protein refolding chaperone
VAGAVNDALAQVDVPKEKQAEMAAIVNDLGEHASKVREAFGDFILALADQIGGKGIDRCSLQPKIDALVTAREHAAPHLQASFSELHDALNSCQRDQFADALEAVIADREAKAQSGEWLDDLAKSLDLSSDQKDKIKSAIGELDSGVASETKEREKILDAFREDTFSPEKLTPADEVAKRAKARADRMVTLAEDLYTILTPEQRTELSDAIHEKSEKSSSSERRS